MNYCIVLNDIKQWEKSFKSIENLDSPSRVRGKKSVENCLPQKIVEMNHKLDPYFVSKELNMKFKPKTKSDDVSKRDD